MNYIYNGEYEQCLEVVISSKSHEVTLEAIKRVYYLCKAWSVRYTEHKSARKGDVLKRDILIYQTDHAHNIIIFKESLECICFQLKRLPGITINFINRGVAPKDSRRDLVNQIT